MSLCMNVNAIGLLITAYSLCIHTALTSVIITKIKIRFVEGNGVKIDKSDLENSPLQVLNGTDLNNWFLLFEETEYLLEYQQQDKSHYWTYKTAPTPDITVTYTADFTFIEPSSESPTSIPTQYPSQSTETITPDPSEIPTDSPSKSPVMSTDNTPKSTSTLISSGEMDDTNSDDIISTLYNNESLEDNEQMLMDQFAKNYVYIIIAAGLLCLIFYICILIFCRKKREKKEKEDIASNNNQSPSTESDNISPISPSIANEILNEIDSDHDILKQINTIYVLRKTTTNDSVLSQTKEVYSAEGQQTKHAQQIIATDGGDTPHLELGEFIVYDDSDINI